VSASQEGITLRGLVIELLTAGVGVGKKAGTK
jgi:hypothetical protein